MKSMRRDAEQSYYIALLHEEARKYGTIPKTLELHQIRLRSSKTWRNVEIRQCCSVLLQEVQRFCLNEHSCVAVHVRATVS